MRKFSTPRQILNAYRAGFKGSICDPKDVASLLGDLSHPLFGASAYELRHSGEGQLSLPFKSLVKFDPSFGGHERQTTGDCVSHSTRNAVDITRAVEIDVNNEMEEFVARGATEGIYGHRGHAGQGMSCSRAARFVNEYGGVLLRQDYEELDLDLSEYDSDIGAKWGKRGVPDDIVEEASKHQVRTISLVTTVEEARDALANGYSISACSGYGFSSRRDSNGFAKPQGNWNHAMCWIGCDDTHEVYRETCFLIQNSWGFWNNGPKKHEQPDGSFWVRESVARKMLAQQGSWVFSSVDGFPARELPDYGTDDYL